MKIRPRQLLPVLALGVALGCARENPPRTLTVAYSNDLRGEIRSCGCATEDYGGLGRRATFLESVRDTAGDFLLVDGGDFFSAKLNYGREKADLTLRSMAMMGYDAVVIGEADLGFGLEFIEERTRSLKLPVVVSNLYDARSDTLIFPATREVTLASGLRVGIVGAVSPRLKIPPQVTAGTLKVTPVADAVESRVEEMRNRVDVVVLLAHMTRGEVERLAERVNGIDLIVYGHEANATRRVRRVGGAYPLQASDRGRYAGIAFAVLGDDGGIRSLRLNTTPLDDTWADDEAITKLFQTYDLDIRAKEQSTVPVGVLNAGEKPVEPFAGAEACRECHEDVYDQWMGTRHASAFATLVDESREFDRDCTPCHSTGFDKLGGFISYTTTPELVNVQCESCHGNGNAHSNDPEVATSRQPRTACESCHVADKSPDFDFDAYWTRIQH